jgi:hypothetical protein
MTVESATANIFVAVLVHLCSVLYIRANLGALLTITCLLLMKKVSKAPAPGQRAARPKGVRPSDPVKPDPESEEGSDGEGDVEAPAPKKGRPLKLHCDVCLKSPEDHFVCSQSFQNTLYLTSLSSNRLASTEHVIELENCAIASRTSAVCLSGCAVPCLSAKRPQFGFDR